MVRGDYFYKREVANRFDNECAILQRLGEGDTMSAFAPEFMGGESIDDVRYLKMRHFLLAFDQATLCQMDVKLGVRTHAESELSSTKPRKDLFERLQSMNPSVLTVEELAAGSITKARWMTLRDTMSSTRKHGFRIDGIITPTTRRTAFGDLANVAEDAQILETLRYFFPAAAGGQPQATAAKLLERLGDLERALRQSTLFAESEVIGSSVLFAADATGRCGLWVLDFGLTVPSPCGPVRHDVPWERGNHEDGYLIGLSNLQRLFATLVEQDRWL